MTTGIVLAIVIIGILIGTWYMLWSAPMGYEDEDGFHLGENPEDEL